MRTPNKAMIVEGKPKIISGGIAKASYAYAIIRPS